MLEKSRAARQKKRMDNIAMKNERRKEKLKGIKSKSRPGFEGRSFKKSGHSSKSGSAGRGK